ncbi:hypothetical protein K438DRAFT_1764980 [Mycena galopus ATCC 62051]|nr:hypothetical protein K438DRAFT_1764980 [Mycena galopus ATCC 62051]
MPIELSIRLMQCSSHSESDSVDFTKDGSYYMHSELTPFVPADIVANGVQLERLGNNSLSDAKKELYALNSVMIFQLKAKLVSLSRQSAPKVQNTKRWSYRVVTAWPIGSSCWDHSPFVFVGKAFRGKFPKPDTPLHIMKEVIEHVEAMKVEDNNDEDDEKLAFALGYSYICEPYLSMVTVRRKEENYHFAVGPNKQRISYADRNFPKTRRRSLQRHAIMPNLSPLLGPRGSASNFFFLLPATIPIPVYSTARSTDSEKSSGQIFSLTLWKIQCKSLPYFVSVSHPKHQSVYERTLKRKIASYLDTEAIIDDGGDEDNQEEKLSPQDFISDVSDSDASSSTPFEPPPSNLQSSIQEGGTTIAVSHPFTTRTSSLGRDQMRLHQGIRVRHRPLCLTSCRQRAFHL